MLFSLIASNYYTTLTKWLQIYGHKTIMSYQDSSLLISTFTNDLAIVPDIFTRKRSRGTGEDLLDHFLYEQNILGEEPKRHCPLPNTQYIAQSDFYLQPSFQFEMQQAIKEVPTLSFVSNAAAPEARKSNQEKMHMVILEEPEQVSCSAACHS